VSLAQITTEQKHGVLQFCSSKSVLNKLLLTNEVIRNVEIHFHVPGAIIFAL
jgi:hypothetical protein